MRCVNCKYWGVDNDEHDALFGTKRCAKAIQMWCAGEWAEIAGEEPDHFGYVSQEFALLPEHADQMMFVKDGSDYRADLYTKPDFFCAHFESPISKFEGI